MKDKEHSHRGLWNNTMHTNIHILGVPEEEAGEKKAERIYERIMVKLFTHHNLNEKP